MKTLTTLFGLGLVLGCLLLALLVLGLLRSGTEDSRQRHALWTIQIDRNVHSCKIVEAGSRYKVKYDVDHDDTNILPTSFRVKTELPQEGVCFGQGTELACTRG